jgi:hypothetical protein
MSLFGRKKSSPAQPQAGTAVAREPVARLDSTHSVFQLQAGMDKDAVIGLLGGDYWAMNSGQLFGGGDATKSVAREECWLYSNCPHGHDVQIVFRSGSLVSAEVKTRNPGGAGILLARIDRNGLAAAEPYRTDLGAEKL